MNQPIFDRDTTEQRITAMEEKIYAQMAACSETERAEGIAQVKAQLATGGGTEVTRQAMQRAIARFA